MMPTKQHSIELRDFSIEWYIRRYKNTLNSGMTFPSDEIADALRDWLDENLGSFVLMGAKEIGLVKAV